MSHLRLQTGFFSTNPRSFSTLLNLETVHHSCVSWLDQRRCQTVIQQLRWLAVACGVWRRVPSNEWHWLIQPQSHCSCILARDVTVVSLVGLLGTVSLSVMCAYIIRCGCGGTYMCQSTCCCSV